MDEYKSTQTLYREIRVKYIRGTIANLIDLLEIPRKNLEKIPLSFFRNLKTSVESELILEKDSEREMAGVAISENDHLHSVKTTFKKHFFEEKEKEQIPIRMD